MTDQTPTTPEPKSKSQLKREMLALQELGKQLTELTPQQLSRFPLDDTLRTAVIAAQNINSNGAYRRQLQYIGRLMRERDPEPIQRAFTALHQHDHVATAKQHRLEKYRDLLLTQGDDAIAEVLLAFPDADRQLLRQLIRQANAQQKNAQPVLAARKIFRYLRDLSEENQP